MHFRWNGNPARAPDCPPSPSSRHYRELAKKPGASPATTATPTKALAGATKKIEADIRVALPRPRAHGAAQLRGAGEGGRLRHLDRRPVADRRPGQRCQGPGHRRRRQVQHPHDVRRRQLRPARQHPVRLHRRGGGHRQAHGCAGEDSCGRARTTSTAATTGPATCTPWKRAWMPKASPSPGNTASSASRSSPERRSRAAW